MKQKRKDVLEWALQIAGAILNWDRESINDLDKMLRDLKELIKLTPCELADFLDLNRMPSMPHPKHGYTHVIWAVDRKGQALVGDNADDIMPISDITSSSVYADAEAIFADIVNWDQKDVSDLRNRFDALRATIAVQTLTAFDIVDSDCFIRPDIGEYSPAYKIWAMDDNENVLTGDDANDIKSIDTILVDGLLAEATAAAGEIRHWNKRDVKNLQSSLQFMDELLSDELLVLHPAYKRRDAFLDMFSLPTADIPRDLDTQNLWAVDESGHVLVGPMADEIMTIGAWRKMKSS